MRLNSDSIKVEALLHVLVLPLVLALLALCLASGAFDPVEWWRARHAPTTRVQRYAAMRNDVRARKYPEALRRAHEILATEPESSEALRVALGASVLLKQPAEARAIGEKLVKIEPADMNVRLALAQALRLALEWGEAAVQLRFVWDHPGSTPQQKALAREALAADSLLLDRGGAGDVQSPYPRKKEVVANE